MTIKIREADHYIISRIDQCNSHLHLNCLILLYLLLQIFFQLFAVFTKTGEVQSLAVLRRLIEKRPREGLLLLASISKIIGQTQRISAVFILRKGISPEYGGIIAKDDGLRLFSVGFVRIRLVFATTGGQGQHHNHSQNNR